MPTDGALPEHIVALLSADAYPDDIGGDVRLIQTHVSYVLLAGEDVYKIKKPVNFGFIDYSTLEKRRRACEDEVRLNRRGCPEIYRGVVPVTASDGRFSIGGGTRAVDYAVHMKRLPPGRMMDELLAADAVTLPMLGRLAGRLATYHNSASRSEQITRIGGAAGFARNWRENLGAIASFTGRTVGTRQVQQLKAYSESFLRDEAPLLERRDREGWIRDCHGDLRSDAVCFDDSLAGGIGLVDCIEFNDALRYTDTGLDIAFLTMDIAFRGRRDLADVLTGLYCAAIGDRELPLLLHAYRCYRAGVRGLVESLTLDDPAVSKGQKVGARSRARGYFRLAESSTKRQKDAGIVLVMGLSGSGKSVLAGAVASRLGAVYLATDIARRELDARTGRGAAVDSGKYGPRQREAVYDRLAELARAYAEEGRAVVLDGTYIEGRLRAPLMALAAELQVPLTVVECQTSDAVVRQRQAQRETEEWSASEGRWEVFLAQKQRYEPPTEVPPGRHLAIDTTAPLADQINAVEAWLRRRS